MRFSFAVGIVFRSALLPSLCTAAHAQGLLSEHHQIPGGVVSMVVGSIDMPRPEVKFGSRSVFVTHMQRRWVALLGLSLTSVPGRYVVAITYNEDESEIRDFVVRPHRYPVKRFVEPVRRRETTETEEAAKLSDRRLELRELAGFWSEHPMTGLPLQLPVEGTQTDEYGLRWVTGDGLTDPVDHVDFKAPPGSNVRAPGDGTIHRIIRVNDNSVAICVDHGMGMLSIIGPMRDTQVETGDRVARNAVLGVSPSGSESVRVSWFLALNRVWVNPMLLAKSP